MDRSVRQRPRRLRRGDALRHRRACAVRDARVGQFQATHELGVHFLRPLRPGRVVGTGRVVHRDGDMAYLEASLADAGGRTIATATATARVIPLAEARSAV